jgi:hypothetical protein
MSNFSNIYKYAFTTAGHYVTACMLCPCKGHLPTSKQLMSHPVTADSWGQTYKRRHHQMLLMYNAVVISLHGCMSS